MKRAGVSFLMVFVLMLTLGTQVFAANDGIELPTYGGERETTQKIYGQHGYGLLRAIILPDEKHKLTVMLYEVSETNSERAVYTLTATPDNRINSVHYYLEGGKRYTIKVYSQGTGLGQLYNYIP